RAPAPARAGRPGRRTSPAGPRSPPPPSPGPPSAPSTPAASARRAAPPPAPPAAPRSSGPGPRPPASCTGRTRRPSAGTRRRPPPPTAPPPPPPPRTGPAPPPPPPAGRRAAHPPRQCRQGQAGADVLQALGPDQAAGQSLRLRQGRSARLVLPRVPVQFEVDVVSRRQQQRQRQQRRPRAVGAERLAGQPAVRGDAQKHLRRHQRREGVLAAQRRQHAQGA